MSQYSGLLSLLLLVSHIVSAEVRVTESTTHYLIAPTSVADIKVQLRQQSPISKNEQTFHGGTRWTLAPYFRLYRHGGLCKIIQVSVHLHTTYTLPKLTEKSASEESIKKVFNQYYTNLVAHEKGHHQISKEAAEAIKAVLDNQEPHYDCAQLQRIVKMRIQKKIDAYKGKHQEYDQSTGFGRSQGAVIR